MSGDPGIAWWTPRRRVSGSSQRYLGIETLTLRQLLKQQISAHNSAHKHFQRVASRLAKDQKTTMYLDYPGDPSLQTPHNTICTATSRNAMHFRNVRKINEVMHFNFALQLYKNALIW